MKDNSVWSLLYPYFPTRKLPTSVALPMSKLDKLIKDVKSYSSSSSLSLSMSWGGGGMNLMKNNLVQRGLEEYKAGLLSLLGRIMGRVKGYTSRGGVTVTTMG